jgi:hypothetical protein
VESNASNLNYKDRSRLIVVIGALLLLAGIAVGFLGPLEMYCFYLFSEGGRFHYPGFGFGSFMFGNIAAQIIGYYMIAAALIPLGYGHLTMRRWARPLALTLLWSWLVIGAPVTAMVSFILLASKDLSLPAALAALIFLALSYLALPALLIRFYGGQNVRRSFEAKDAEPCWIEDLPVPALVLSALYLFYIVMLHVLILFNGMYPVFGSFRFGFQGILLIDFSIACLAFLAWGTLRLKAWAWWGAVILGGLFTLSTVLTFFMSSYSDILSGLAFPPREMEIFGGMPIQGYYFSVPVGMPLIISWLIALLSKRHFRAGGV